MTEHDPTQPSFVQQAAYVYFSTPTAQPCWHATAAGSKRLCLRKETNSWHLFEFFIFKCESETVEVGRAETREMKSGMKPEHQQPPLAGAKVDVRVKFLYAVEKLART
jgi:hypothetical protein